MTHQRKEWGLCSEHGGSFKNKTHIKYRRNNCENQSCFSLVGDFRRKVKRRFFSKKNWLLQVRPFSIDYSTLPHIILITADAPSLNTRRLPYRPWSRSQKKNMTADNALNTPWSFHFMKRGKGRKGEYFSRAIFGSFCTMCKYHLHPYVF
mgnify:CR=1 FL=1